MILHIPKDIFNNPTPPQVFLCQTNKDIIGELPIYNTRLVGKWNTYSELTFSVDRMYNDVLTGETKVHPLFDLVEGLRKVYVRGYGYFVIQDPDSTYSDNETKTITAFSSEYETSTKFLENFYVNNGADESIEVTYWANKYGNNYYNKDDYYKLAGNNFDAYTRYYYKEYSDSDSYVYTEIQIIDQSDFDAKKADTAYGDLYVKSYPNVQFYNPTTPELSLLHCIFAKIPEWKIGNVDLSLYKQERKFEQERISVYDFLMNEMADTFKCVVEWDTINNTVNFYAEAEDGINDDETIQDRFETDVFISRDNLASEINIKYSTDNIKTKLKVTGGDDLTIRDINIGQNYIMNLDYYHTVEWMGQDLYDHYTEYKNLLESKQEEYQTEMQGWVGTYNKWNDLMNAIPATNNALLVGDTFQQLYCAYTPVYKDDDTQEQKNSKVAVAKDALIKKLELYRIKDDTYFTNADNVLLTLKHSNGNSATIRVCYNTTDKVYQVRRILTNVSTDGSVTTNYTLEQWIKETLSASYMKLDDYTIASIGTLGAYLCLVKNESQREENKEYLRTFGINLLKERQKTYTKIFIAQTEKYMSKEESVCIAQDDPPTGEISVGTRWLDTNSSPMRLYQYSGSAWEVIANTANDVLVINASDYTRYKENYDKLKAVQEVLLEKELVATYYLDGKPATTHMVTPEISEDYFKFLAIQYFKSIGKPVNSVIPISWDENIPLYKFKLSSTSDITYAVYLKDNMTHIAYANSCGVHQAMMNNIKEAVNMETYFTTDDLARLNPFIREDEFNDSNIALNGYESEEERISLCNELKKNANKELKTLCQPSLEFTMTMANILALPEFSSIKNQFALGNYIRVGIRPGYVKRTRLLEVDISFDDMSDFSATFGNLITTKNQIDLHADLMKQAIQAGKTVAQSAGNWQKAVDKSNKIDKAISEGLKDATLSVASTNGQDISWDERGILCRKKVDGTEDQYEDEQILITNNKIVGTKDGFETSKGVFGSYEYNGQKYYGVLAEAVIGGIINGSEIIGGKLEIGGDGGRFVVHEDGSVEIFAANGENKYASTSALSQIEQSRQYHIELVYSGSTIFTQPNQQTIITCKVYKWDTDITDKIKSTATFKWIRTSNNSTNDSIWNNGSHTYTGDNTIKINNSDIDSNAQFYCEVTFNEPS